MPRCRSPPFLSEKQADKKEMEETLWQFKFVKRSSLMDNG